MIDLKPEYLKTVKSILKKHVPDITARAFGSRINNSAKKYSDLDIVLMTTEPLDGSLLFKLKDAFSESDLPFMVDILDWSTVGDEFREVIKSDYEVIED